MFTPILLTIAVKCSCLSPSLFLTFDATGKGSDYTTVAYWTQLAAENQCGQMASDCVDLGCEQVPDPKPSLSPACSCNPAHTVCTCEIDPH